MIVVVPAPSALGLKPSGVQDLADRILRHGLADRLGARVLAPVQVPAYTEERDPEDGIRNKAQIAVFTQRLADAVQHVLDGDDFPLVLGGDCSILLGNLLALRRRGRPGLLFLDGHADFYQPEANINGEAASSELAFATGRGPQQLTRFEGHERLLQEEDVVVMGQRDANEAAQYGSQDLSPLMRQYDLEGIRRTGASRVATEAVAHLASAPRNGFWVHLDVDVLDDALMPAVDYRLQGGLSWKELDTILQAAVSSPRCQGVDVTIYNPRLDDSGAGEALVEHLCHSLGSAEARVRGAT